MLLSLLYPSVLTAEIDQLRTSIVKIDLRYQSLGYGSKESHIDLWDQSQRSIYIYIYIYISISISNSVQTNAEIDTEIDLYINHRDQSMYQSQRSISELEWISKIIFNYEIVVFILLSMRLPVHETDKPSGHTQCLFDRSPDCWSPVIISSASHVRPRLTTYIP